MGGQNAPKVQNFAQQNPYPYLFLEILENLLCGGTF